MSTHYPRIRAALSPAIALSCAGMGTSGAYLLYEGHMYALWTATLGLFFSPFFFPFLMIPAAIFGNIMRMVADKRPKTAHVLHALSIGWLAFVMSGWSAAVFEFARIPLLEGGVVTGAATLWCVAASVAPWAVFVSGDRDNVFMTVLVLMLGVAAAAAAAVGYGDEVTFWARCGTVTLFMCVMAGIQALWEERKLKSAPPAA